VDKSPFVFSRGSYYCWWCFSRLRHESCPISFLVLSHWCDSSFYENQARVLLDPRASVVAVAPHRGFYITHDSDVVVSLPDALDDSKDHIKVESLVFKRLMDVGLNISCPESARDAIDLAVSHALGK